MPGLLLQTALAASVTWLLTACSTPRTASPAQPLFYPAPPAQPRIQFLAAFSGGRDFDRPPGRWYDYIVGRVDETPVELAKPYGLLVAGGRVLACDTVNRAIAVFDLAGRQTSSWQPGGEGRLHTPINLAGDEQGVLYVADTGRGNVSLYDASSNYLGAIAEPDGMKPTDVAVAGDRVYITDLQRAQVAVYDRATRRRLFAIPRQPGDEAARLFQPTNLAVDPQGRIHVCDSGAFCVKVFDAEGRHLRTIGGHGDGPGQFARPKGIALDRAGRCYVVDAAMQVVQIFDADGELLLYFGEPGDQVAGLDLPADVTIDYSQVGRFQALAAPGFTLEHLILVSNQYGPDKVGVYGFGHAP